ncbi:non-specific lipid transfer protein GPI-anchored 5-like isoform X1 [Quercus suber]|uniref:non-specific lipid transfer protein GPI-anchored 5-like isoform X1 n=1 Tax=Quercus suber TaxID=58331 RepID=UPI0032DEC037
MAFNGTEKGLVLVLVAMLWSGAMAQSGCTSVLSNLAPCLNYITGNSSTPSSSCCSQLSNVVQSSPQCLCTALNGGAASLGININKTRALSLPSACNVQTPPISQCKGANGTPPVGSPADSSDEAPAGATTTSASGIPSVWSGHSHSACVRSLMVVPHLSVSTLIRLRLWYFLVLAMSRLPLLANAMLHLQQTLLQDHHLLQEMDLRQYRQLVGTHQMGKLPN